MISAAAAAEQADWTGAQMETGEQKNVQRPFTAPASIGSGAMNDFYATQINITLFSGLLKLYEQTQHSRARRAWGRPVFFRSQQPLEME